MVQIKQRDLPTYSNLGKSYSYHEVCVLSFLYFILPEVFTFIMTLKFLIYFVHYIEHAIMI